MSYPLRDSPSERTGDRLMIRCLEFSPPEDGSGLNISLRNAFKKDSKGNLSAILPADRDLIKANQMTIEQPTADGKGTYNMKHDDKMAIDFKNTDANTRLGSGMKQRTKFYIELPIPQDLTDSNSITWGDDLSLIHI